jgi:HEAT repeat protein
MRRGLYQKHKQITNMPQSKAHPAQPLELVSKLPMRQRIATLSDSILVVPPAQRDEIAMMLIELASFHPSLVPNETDLGNHEHEVAASPLELLARIPQRWQSRHANEAMLGVARAWAELSGPMRELAVALGRDRWIESARILSRSSDASKRLAALEIAHDTADPGFATIAGALLADEDQAVRKSADRALMRLTMVMLEHLPAELLGEDLAEIAARPRVRLPVDPAVLALERCTLLGAIADAAWSFASHRCRSPLLGALLVMDRAVATPLEREICARMRKLLSERQHPSHSPIRTVLRRTPCPILRERALRWLTIEPISSAGLDRLSTCDSVFEHEIVLEKSHLGIRPKRAAKLQSLHHGMDKNARAIPAMTGAGIGSDHKVLPEREVYSQLSDDARLGLVRFTSQIAVDDQVKRDLLEPTLADPSARVRLCACATSSMIDLPDFLYDVEPGVARTGALKWSSTGQTPPRVSTPAWTHRMKIATTNARSPHAWLRRISSEERDRLTMIRPCSPASRAQARRMYKNDPAGFVRMLRDYLADPDTRCDALMLIRILGIARRFELDLISLVQSEEHDPRARATAVMALGDVGTNAAGYILSEALRDGDHRIRSNAVESIPVSGKQVLELKLDDHHRVRASAIRRVIRETGASDVAQSRDAGHALLEMLHDTRPMHRLAATWAAQRSLTGQSREVMGTTWKPLVQEIELLASGYHSAIAGGDSVGVLDQSREVEQDLRIRSRAQRCIHRISCDLELAQHARQQAIGDQRFWDGGPENAG